MTFGEFWRKYKVLSESSNTLSENLGVEQVKSAVQDLLEELDLDKTAVRLGNTQVSVYRFHLLRCLSYNWIYMSNYGIKYKKDESYQQQKNIFKVIIQKDAKQYCLSL